MKPPRTWIQLAPCADCPFRRQGAIDLRPGRLQEIIGDLLRGEGFLCHAHFYARKRQRQPCAGAVIYLEKAGRPNTIMQVMERVGDYPREAFMASADLVIDPANS